MTRLWGPNGMYQGRRLMLRQVRGMGRGPFVYVTVRPGKGSVVSWHMHNLTQASQALKAIDEPASHVVQSEGTQHVFHRADLGGQETIVELWWSDERCVRPEDERSNYGMAKAALLDRLAVAPAAVHRMRGELGRDGGAAAYEHELETLARFDLVLLGLGPDGHVASLYPDQPTLDETARRAIGAEAHLQPFVDRITLTLPVLCAARAILFLVAGADKADAAKRAFAGEPSGATPGSLVRAAEGTTTALLDPPAAAQLSSK